MVINSYNNNSNNIINNNYFHRNKRLRWEDNIKMNLQEVEWDVVDWIDMAQDRARWRAFVNVVMNLRIP
jgi:hypothetical protein